MATVTYTPLPDLMSLQEYARNKGKSKVDLQVIKDFYSDLHTIPESREEPYWSIETSITSGPMNNRGRLRVLRHLAERLLQLAQDVLDRVRCRRSADQTQC